MIDCGNELLCGIMGLSGWVCDNNNNRFCSGNTVSCGGNDNFKIDEDSGSSATNNRRDSIISVILRTVLKYSFHISDLYHGIVVQKMNSFLQ